MPAYLMWTPKGGKAKSLYFDAITSEDQDLTSKVTEHPVENGPDVADHIRRELDAVTLEVFVSNAPAYDVNGRGGRVVPVEIKVDKYKAPFSLTPGALFSAVGDAVSSVGDAIFGGSPEKISAQVMKFGEEFDAVSDTLVLLRGIRNTGQLVDVMLPSRIYQDMALTRIGVHRDGIIGDAARFSLEFREVRKVRVSVVAAPTPTEPRATPKKKAGTKDAKDIEVPAKKKSLLKSLLG